VQPRKSKEQAFTPTARRWNRLKRHATGDLASALAP
jgi:hypothetical protein